MINGRGQRGRNEAELKRTCLDALAYGLVRRNKGLPANAVIEFPYYGDLLADLVTEVETPLGAEILAKGPNPDAADQQFRGEVIGEIAASVGLTDADIQREVGGPTEKGPGNWEWV